MSTTTPALPRRLAAAGALLAAIAAVFCAAFILTSLGLTLLVVLCAVVIIIGSWEFLSRRGLRRIVGGVVALIALVGGIIAILVHGQYHGLMMLLAVLLIALSVALARYALGWDKAALKAQATPGERVSAGRKPILIMNPKSGGGKVERFHLVDEATARGIEPVILHPGDDLLQLAKDAVARGADVLGMAGGDGSQALVASVAAEHDLPFVCIPAGTRMDFARDLGLDVEDPVGALDAFIDGVERRIDLARVGDRVFVNNVSLGIYGTIVQSPGYREAKLRTAADVLPDLLGEADPSGLTYTGPDGVDRVGAQLIQVSNNPYHLRSLAAFASRPRLDTGELGILAARIDGAKQAVQFIALEASGRAGAFAGWQEWSAPVFEIRSAGPVTAGVDGEALVFDPPVTFAAMPSCLRIRMPHTALGYSKAAIIQEGGRWSLGGLLGVIAGRPGR